MPTENVKPHNQIYTLKTSLSGPKSSGAVRSSTPIPPRLQQHLQFRSTRSAPEELRTGNPDAITPLDIERKVFLFVEQDVYGGPTILHGTTTRAVRKAITNLTSVSVDDLKIKRKYKTAEKVSSSTAPKRIIRLWFVVRANESILQQVDGEWHKVALQTDLELTPLLQYVNSQSQSNPSQDDVTLQN